jgi:hypothetical protein
LISTSTDLSIISGFVRLEVQPQQYPDRQQPECNDNPDHHPARTLCRAFPVPPDRRAALRVRLSVFRNCLPEVLSVPSRLGHLVGDPQSQVNELGNSAEGQSGGNRNYTLLKYRTRILILRISAAKLCRCYAPKKQRAHNMSVGSVRLNDVRI